MTTGTWTGCYGKNWKGLIVPQAFSHPAKFSRSLIERIIAHMLERGWLKKGEMCGDPFGGIGCGGIIAAYAGLRWVGVELEGRFVELAKKNFELHAAKWRAMGDPEPVILQGDSRGFASIIGQCAAIATSPPFEKMVATADPNFLTPGEQGKRNPSKSNLSDYGQSPGQIGNLRAGKVDAITTSPPFTQGYSSGGGINVKGYGADGKDKVGERTYQGTGGERAKGNIETLPVGTLRPGKCDAIATSPPYESAGWKADENPANVMRREAKRRKLYPMRPEVVPGRYSDSRENLGNTAGETYWDAVRTVYHQCRLALKPGGVMAVVVKSYVKGGKLVDLPGQTWTLLQSLGFLPLERIRAMLVEEKRERSLLGADIVTRKERKSFFRRLAEKKGSPKIDFEDVLFVRNPSGDGRLDACVTSPPYAEGLGHDSAHPRLDGTEDERRRKEGCARRSGYGHTPGQIGSLKSGDLDAVITSPPYAQTGVANALGGNQIDHTRLAELTKSKKDLANTKQRADTLQYGQTPGQIARLKEGKLPTT